MTRLKLGQACLGMVFIHLGAVSWEAGIWAGLLLLGLGLWLLMTAVNRIPPTGV